MEANTVPIKYSESVVGLLDLTAAITLDTSCFSRPLIHLFRALNILHKAHPSTLLILG